MIFACRAGHAADVVCVQANGMLSRKKQQELYQWYFAGDVIPEADVEVFQHHPEAASLCYADAESRLGVKSW